MQKSNSQIKETNQSNYSSVPTITYCSSPAYSPIRNKSSFDKERLISEPKYSNENIFAKKVSSAIANINQSLNIKPRNNGIYITGLENESNMYSDLIKSVQTTNENTNISKSISNKDKKDKKTKLNKRLSLEPLPYIFNTNQNEDLIPMSPVFSCCNKENSPKLLNRILYRQKLQEFKENSSKTSGNENNKINTKSKKTTVKDGPKNYISKIRDLNRIKYSMNLKLETIKDHYYDYRQELKNIDFTINSIKAYKYSLENKFINQYLSQLRTLNKITLNERLKEEQQRNEIVKLKKEISNMLYDKKRLEITKFLIEKWIGLQIYIKDKVRVEENQIKIYLNKHYKGKLIFPSPEEFNDFFKKKEISNLRLIKTLNIKTEEKANFFKILQNLQIANREDDNYLINAISEKEKALKLLKKRNQELLQEIKEVSKLKNQSSQEEAHPIQLSSSPLTPKKEKNNIKTYIDYDIIYSKIQNTFDYIILNDRSALSESNESLQYIKVISNPSTKALAQMKIIEQAFIFLVYYKSDNIKGNEDLYNKLLEEIEFDHKAIKIEKYRKEEEQRLLKLHQKMEKKKNRIVFKPTRQDNYSSLIYIEKLKSKERKMKKTVKKKLDIFDFLYDIDDDKMNAN